MVLVGLNRLDIESLLARSVNLCLCTLPVLRMHHHLLLLLHLVLSHGHGHRSATVVHFIDSTGGCERRPLRLLGRNHVLAHADEFFDKELKDSILVCSLHLSQLLQFRDLDYVWVLFKLLLLDYSLLLSQEHLLVVYNLIVFGLKHLLVFHLLHHHGFLTNLDSLATSTALTHSCCFFDECTLWRRRSLTLKKHGWWAIRFVQQARHGRL